MSYPFQMSYKFKFKLPVVPLVANEKVFMHQLENTKSKHYSFALNKCFVEFDKYRKSNNEFLSTMLKEAA